MRIIYEQASGIVGVLVPASKFLETFPSFKNLP